MWAVSEAPAVTAVSEAPAVTAVSEAPAVATHVGSGHFHATLPHTNTTLSQ